MEQKRLCYQDKRVAVAIKPSGVLSTDEPGGMPELVRAELGTPCVRTVHRLDRVVGGLMVFARSAAAASELSRQVREHRMQKKYLAVVHGMPTPICGTFRDLLRRDRAERRTYVTAEPGRDVQEAELSYRTLETTGALSLVEITLKTGRTHQIRVQFSSRKLPLVGDRKYGRPEDECSIALWSSFLGFYHPESGEWMEFSALPPRCAPWTGFEALFGQPERLDVVDDMGRPTGEQVLRSLAHTAGIQHRTAHVWLLRHRGGQVQILLQRRSAEKDSFPGCYDISSAGHIPAGVDYVPSALRELQEELGCTAQPEQLIFCGQRRFEVRQNFHGRPFFDRQVSHVYVLWLDQEPEQFRLQREEVAEVRWVELEACIRQVAENRIPNCISLEELEMVRRAAVCPEKRCCPIDNRKVPVLD